MLSEDLECLDELYSDEDHERWCREEDYEDYEEKEKYYWKTQEGKYIKVDDLTDNHIKNIVYLFGKQRLNNHGYHNIVEKFNKIIRNKGEKV